MTKVSFSSQKDCREFINKYRYTMFFIRDQVKNISWLEYGFKPIEVVKLGRIKNIKGISIYLEGGIKNVSKREYNLYRILNEE